MIEVLDRIHHFAQQHSRLVTANLHALLPKTRLRTGGEPNLAAASQLGELTGVGINNIDTAICSRTSADPWRLVFSHETCPTSSQPAPPFFHQISESQPNSAASSLVAFADRLGLELQKDPRPRRSHPTHLLTAALFLTAFIILSWVRRSCLKKHRQTATLALRLAAFISLVSCDISVEDWLLALLVMVSFDVFQDAADQHTTAPSESDALPQPPRSPVETLLSRLPPVLAQFATTQSDLASVLRRSHSVLEKADPAPTTGAYDSKDRVIVKLQRTLSDLQTASKTKQLELRTTRHELLNARDALNNALAGQSFLKEEMKTLKQTLGREHQAIVYRKDIELFALRKGNEQKEKIMKERDAKLDEAFRQQHTALELKEAQLAMLKERLEAAERQASPKIGDDDTEDENPDGDHALEVRLLRVRKGRKFTGTDDEKDAVIAKLQQELAVAIKAAEDVVNQQAELQRAWEINKKIQTALKEERERHDQTKLHLEEATVKLAEEAQNAGRRHSSGRLSTIEEQDQNELEAMFDNAQQDNHRLHVQVETLEKRVRDANARVFTAEQEVTTLRDQIQQEKSINSDLTDARPSVVHRVHFQRMEGQLQEARDELAKKEEELLRLKNILSEKTSQLEALQKEAKREKRKSLGNKEEIERLRRTVADLESTKEQLLLDQARFASQQSSERVPSTELTSARCSGATLVTDQSPPALTQTPDGMEPVPPIPLLSFSTVQPISLQEVPPKQVRKVSSTTSSANRNSILSDNEASSDVKQARRKSWGMRDLMKRMVKKEMSDGSLDIPPVPELPKEKSSVPSKSPAAPLVTSLPSMAKTQATSQRPQTAAVDRPKTSHKDRPRTAVVDRPKTSHKDRPQTLQKDRPKTSLKARPQTAVKENPQTATKERPRTASAQDHTSILRPLSFMSTSTSRSRSTTLEQPIPTRRSSLRTVDTESHRPRTATLPGTLRPTLPRVFSQPRYYAESPIEEVERPNTAAVTEDIKKRRKHDSGVDMADAEKLRPLSRLSWGSAYVAFPPISD
jgi:hypothetical protein